MIDATTLDRPVQPTLQVRQIVPGQNYREHYDAKALADLRDQVKAADILRVVERNAARPDKAVEQLIEAVNHRVQPPPDLR